jgi:glycosyltransferase involved in cell wall biosynthesis
MDSRIKLVNIPENMGASVAKNLGLEKAICECITIVDDDDFCEPQMLDFLWNLLVQYKVDISMCGSWNVFDGKREPYFIFDDLLVLNKSEALIELLKRERYNVAPPTKLFRTSLFKGLKFKENVLVDDIHVIYKVFANAGSVAVQGVPLYSFTKHSGNMTNFIHTNRLTPDLLEEYLSMYRERTKYLSERVPEIAERAQYSEWSFMLSMCEKIQAYKCLDCKHQYNYMIKTLRANGKEILNSSFITQREREIIQRYKIKNRV